VANTNPADAPYPQWSAAVDYPLGWKVVSDGEIFQAKWYNSGQDPQAQVQYAYQSPWELLGPVLPGDHAPDISVPTTDAFPAWSITTSYPAGAKVLFDGLPYQAKYPSLGDSPVTQVSDPTNSPWKALYKIPGEPVQQASPGV
jgi:chitinase